MKTEKQITKQTKETESKRGPRTVHIFDDVFRTMCEKMPKLLIPLINEAFGTSYSEDETLVQLRNERFQSLIMEFEDIIGRLEDALPHDQEGYRRRLLELINRISKYITRNKRSLKKGLGDIMGGRVLELETDKIMAEAEARGKKLGLNEKRVYLF